MNEWINGTNRMLRYADAQRCSQHPRSGEYSWNFWVTEHCPHYTVYEVCTPWRHGAIIGPCQYQGTSLADQPLHGEILARPMRHYEAIYKIPLWLKSFIFICKNWFPKKNLESWLNSDLFRPLALVYRSKIALLRHTQNRLFSLFSGVFEHVLE